MTTTARPLPEHGTLSRYKYRGCRCDVCRENYTAYQRNCRRQQAYGRWQPLLDAAPVREHLLKLHDAGLSYQVIAESLGRSTASITSFIYDLGPSHPRRKRVTAELAAAILALQPGDIPPGMIDATGTVRRIEALVAIGWPMKSISAHVGLAGPTINRVRSQKWVFRPTAEGVARVYEELRHKTPEAHGILPVSAVKARKLAAQNGWRDPLWWEDMGRIDDPNFDPAAVISNTPRYMQLGQDALWLRAQGYNREQVAQRLGASIDYVDQSIKRYRAALGEAALELQEQGYSRQQIAERLGETEDEVTAALERHMEALAAADSDEQAAAA